MFKLKAIVDIDNTNNYRNNQYILKINIIYLHSNIKRQMKKQMATHMKLKMKLQMHIAMQDKDEETADLSKEEFQISTPTLSDIETTTTEDWRQRIETIRSVLTRTKMNRRCGYAGVVVSQAKNPGPGYNTKEAARVEIDAKKRQAGGASKRNHKKIIKVTTGRERCP